MKKEDLRKKLKAERQSMSEAGVVAKSAAITVRLLEEIDWSNVKSLHVYNSNMDWKEVDTVGFIKKLSSSWPNISISSPSINKGNPIPSEQFDVIVLPVLGFDAQRNRLGLGGGWYDKFLLVQPDALKVGLAYESAYVTEGIPAEDSDIAPDKIITETKTY